MAAQADVVLQLMGWTLALQLMSWAPALQSNLQRAPVVQLNLKRWVREEALRSRLPAQVPQSRRWVQAWPWMRWVPPVLHSMKAVLRRRWMTVAALEEEGSRRGM